MCAVTLHVPVALTNSYHLHCTFVLCCVVVHGIAGWSRLEHSSFKPAVREWVFNVMLRGRRIANVDGAAGGRLPPLPEELWVMIVSMLRAFEMVP